MTKLKEDFEASGGVWKEWNYSNLFTLLKGRKKLSKLDLVENSNVPVYSSDTTNNGIVGYTDLESDYQVNKDIPVYVVFGDHTRTMNIVHKDFCVMDNVKVLIPNINSDKVLQYVTSAWQKSIPNMGYSRHWSCAEVATIYLPTFNNEPSYSYMEQYISLLEEEKMLQVDKFLKDSGLNDTTLTAEETSALEKFRNGEVKFVERKICGENGVFMVNNTHSIQQSWIKENSGVYPYCTASESNNSVFSYISYDMACIEKGNSIMIGGKTLVVTYQEKDYFSNDSHNLALYSKDLLSKSKECQLFLVSQLYKCLKPIYYWGDSISKSKIQKDIISLPINASNEIDYTFMQHFISALEKLVIRGVVKYKDEVLNADGKALDFAVAAEPISSYGQKLES